jgi:hypothetical protein
MSSASSGEDAITQIHVVSAERRPDSGKKFFFQIEILHTSGNKERIWRKFAEFDALYQTMVRVMGNSIPVPKLSSSYFMTSAKQATIVRMGQLQVFLAQLLTFRSNKAAFKTVLFFLHPTAADKAREQQSDPVFVIQHTARTQTASQRARVIEGYTKANDIEISLSRGDVIKIISTENSEFFVGEDTAGHVGRFPARCVEIINDNNEKEASSPTIAPKTPAEELRSTEITYMKGLIDVRSNYFPRLRTIISAPEGKIFFSNWSELIPASQVHFSFQIMNEV